jgi:hypothetical protein
MAGEERMKVFTSLPQHLEDEALADFDRQGDQVPHPFSAELLNSDDPSLAHFKRDLFWFVFGYAQAKGWTSCEKRMAQAKNS